MASTPLAQRLTRQAWEANLDAKKLPTEWMNALVMNYLTTQGHAAAAAMFERETGTPQILNAQSTAVRMRIRNAIEAGRPAEAIDQVVDVNPEIVEERPELLFRLKKQEFIELVRQNRTDEALEFAERELARRVEGDEGLLRELESAMALLLFEDARSSPLGQYLSEEYTHETADLLNASILASETRAVDGRSRLPHMLHLLLWLEARANDAVKKELSGSDDVLSYVPRVALGTAGDGDDEQRPTIDYEHALFSSEAARAAGRGDGSDGDGDGDGVGMDVDSDEDGDEEEVD